MKTFTGALFERLGLVTLLLVSATATARAQDAAARAARLEKYEAAAAQSVEVTLDGPLLRLAVAALSDRNPDERKIKELLGGVKGIYVRSFEFDKEGAYDPAEVRALGAPFRTPGWSRVADVKSGRYENVEVYVSADGAVIRGLAVIAADAKDLTFVNIEGEIRPERLAELEGRFSIPKLRLYRTGKE